MNLLRRPFAKVLASMMLITVSAAPREARAIVGIAGSPTGVGLIVAGSLVTTLGLFAGAAGAVAGSLSSLDMSGRSSGGGGSGAILIILLGIILLDDDRSGDLKFEPLTKNEGLLIGMNDEEFRDFHAYLDELNAVTEQVADEVRKLEKASPVEAVAIWERNRNLVPTPFAYSAMAKISAHWLRAAER